MSEPDQNPTLVILPRALPAPRAARTDPGARTGPGTTTAAEHLDAVATDTTVTLPSPSEPVIADASATLVTSVASEEATTTNTLVASAALAPPTSLGPAGPIRSVEVEAKVVPTLAAERTQVLTSAPPHDDTVRFHRVDLGPHVDPGPHVAHGPRVGLDPEDGRAEDRRRRALGQLACLTSALVMAALGALRLNWPALWGDELATWGMTTVSWGEMWPLLRGFDVVIGPYYALIHAWTDLVGASEVTLRAPSVLAMAGAAALVAAIGTRTASPRVGITAGLLFAVLPTSSRFAQEARPYALATFLAVLATFLLLRALDRPGFWRLTGYALAVAGLGLLHAVALALLAAHLVTVLAVAPRAAVRWVPAAVLGALPAAPLLWLGHQQKVQISWLPLATPERLFNYPSGLFGAALIGGAMVAFGLLAVSARRPAVVHTAWALVPTALVYVAATQTPLWTPRYLLFTLPGWALLAATALGRAPFVRGAVAVAVIAALGLSHQVALRRQDGHSQDTRRVAALLTAHVHPGDGIVYGSRVDGRVGRDVVARYVTPERRPRDLLVVRPPRTGGQTFAAECPDVDACVGRTERVWLLRLGTWNRDNLGSGLRPDRRALLARYRVAEVWRPEGLTLALLTRRDR